MRDAHDPSIDITRRDLLLGGGVVLVTIVAGCSSDDAGGAPMTVPPSDATPRSAPDLSGDPFTLGVASGDPLPTGVVLWTRLAPRPLATDGLGGMPGEEVDVAWEVARDEAFRDVVRSGVAVASPDHAHAVHVHVDGLEPASDYHYRFAVGDHTSSVARTRTLPDGSPERFGVAVVNCQWHEKGTYAAYRRLLEEDVDLVLHLGDYIYEYPSPEGTERATLPAHAVETLADYRLRYASYALDEDLRNAHHRFPFMLTWDDHEVANNYSGDILVQHLDAPEAGRERKRAAYQAWWEHLPVRAEPPDDGELVVYGHVDIGDLARIYLLDHRQFSDPGLCRNGDPDAADSGHCAEGTGDRSLLGAEQEAWFADATSGSAATWNLIGNPVVVGGVDAGNDTHGPILHRWDAYSTARLRFIEQLAAVDNPVVLTGDYHAGMLIDVHERPFEPDTPVVATELMSPPISSPLNTTDVTRRSSHVRRQLNGHGYLTLDVAPDRVRATFRVLDDANDPASAISTPLACRIDAGSPRATIIT